MTHDVVIFEYLNQRSPQGLNQIKLYDKGKISLEILLICVIGISGGCSSTELRQSEIIQERLSQESSEIDGQWVGVVEGMDRKPLELTYRFKTEGTRPIGLIESRLGGGQIQEGIIDGNNIEFKLNAGEFIILNKGVLSDDKIHLTETINDGEIKLVIGRIKR